MGRIDAGKAAQVGGFGFRYLWARHRCTGTEPPASPRRLTLLVAQGTREFDGTNVEPYKEPPITRDSKHPDFFRAIILIDDRGLPALPWSRQWRAYVHHWHQFPERRAEGVGNKSSRAGISRLIRVAPPGPYRANRHRVLATIARW
jgi:hypothetical protein